MYSIKNIELAPQGNLNIEFAEKNMKPLLEIRKKFEIEKPFLGLRIAMALHITKETAVLVKTLMAGGAKVAIASCNPLSTQDDIAAALAADNVEVYGYKGESKEEYYSFLKKVVETKPNITIDDGCDLVTLLHTQHKEYLKDVIGGCEETTTGVLRLKSMEEQGVLKYPVVAVNDNKTKHLMDNFYGTGQSTIDGILRASNVLFASKTVVVAGYGSCGKGVALRAKGLGARVIVTEVDNFRALQACMDGYRVMKMSEAAKRGDIFITVTGNKKIISDKDIKNMKDGAILANSGHFNNEIDMDYLSQFTKRNIRPNFDEYIVDNKIVYVAGDGRLVNLVAAEGHPSEVMSMSFCGQALACEYIIKFKEKLQNRVYTLPTQIDDEIAFLELNSKGIEIDKLTDEQKEYLSGWEEGT